MLAVGRVLEEQLGFDVEHIPVDREGFVDMKALLDALDEKVLAVSIMAVNNEIGTVQNVERIAEVTKACGAVFHCDAAQASLAMPIDDFAEIADMVSLSAHKMYGPKGIGALYLSRTVQSRIEPLIYGGGQQHGLRSGTTPVPLCVGMGVAAEMLCKEEIAQKRSELALRRNAFCGATSPVVVAYRTQRPLVAGSPSRQCEYLFYRVFGARHPGRLATASCGVNRFRMYFGYAGAVPCAQSHRPFRRRGGILHSLQPWFRHQRRRCGSGCGVDRSHAEKTLRGRAVVSRLRLALGLCAVSTFTPTQPPTDESHVNLSSPETAPASSATRVWRGRRGAAVRASFPK